jgi:phage baseplate assembly protein W
MGFRGWRGRHWWDSPSSDQTEIEEAIAIIIGTSPGERRMRPAFGCRIHELVFASNNAETLGLARRFVLEALGMWEPRIEVESINVSADAAEAERGRLNIELTYSIRGTKDLRSLVYPFYLIEND